MPETYHTITAPGALILEASANALTQDEMRGAFDISSKVLRLHSNGLRLNLGMKDLDEAYDLEVRTRAVAMAVHDGLLVEKDLKIPGREYISTIVTNNASHIFIKNSEDPTLNIDPQFKMPARPSAPTCEVEVDARSRTYLSCLAWAMTRQTIAERYAPKELTSEQAIRHVYKSLHVLFKNLAAKNAPQAVAHASFLGLVRFNDAIMDPRRIPSPTIYEKNARISANSFALRMPYRFGKPESE